MSMRLVKIAFVILVFNVMMAVISNSGLTSGSIYYEPEMISNYDNMPENFSAGTETGQYSQTFSMINVILGSVSFNWLLQYVPYGMRTDPAVTSFFLGLNAILAFLYAATIIQMWQRYSTVL